MIDANSMFNVFYVFVLMKLLIKFLFRFLAGIKKGSSGRLREFKKVWKVMETQGVKMDLVRHAHQKAGKVVRSLTGFTVMGIHKRQGTNPYPSVVDISDYMPLWSNLVVQDINQFTPTYTWSS